MSIVLDTPEDIEYFRLLSLRGRLQLELKGVKFRLSTLKAVNKTLGTNYRTKVAALAALDDYIEEKAYARSYDLHRHISQHLPRTSSQADGVRNGGERTASPDGAAQG